jgi:hypothetical protein
MMRWQPSSKSTAPGLRAAAADRRHRHRGGARPGFGGQILRSPTALSPGTDLRSQRHRSRSLTLASWVGRACWWLRPPAELLLGTILSSPKIFADDTPVPVLDPGRGRTKTGRPWAYARDDRPWRGPMPPAVAYVYSENRQGVHPRSHLPRRPGAGRVHSDRFSRCPVDRALALLSQVRTGLAGERTGFEPSVPRKRVIDFRASRST